MTLRYSAYLRECMRTIRTLTPNEQAAVTAVHQAATKEKGHPGLPEIWFCIGELMKVYKPSMQLGTIRCYDDLQYSVMLSALLMGTRKDMDSHVRRPPLGCPVPPPCKG